MEPDFDSIQKAEKALYVIFIIMISVINLVLIVKQVRKPLFYENAKAMIIFSLAIGDLLFALFPLTVMSVFVYGTTVPTSSSCALIISSDTYMNYLIHFLYGKGLVTLGLEVLLRHRIYALNINRKFIAILAGSIPWILSIVIILPLCLATLSSEYCEVSLSLAWKLGVSVFTPASLAVFVTVILNCVKLPTQDYNLFTNIYDPQVVNQPQLRQQSGHQQHRNLFSNNEQQAIVNRQEEDQYPSNQPVVNQYPSNPPGVYPLTMNQQPMVNIYNGNNQTTNTAAVSLTNRKTEVRRLLIIAIVFFILVVPNAAVTLGRLSIRWPSFMTAEVVTEVLYWLSVLRSFLTPLIMLRYFNSL